VTRPDLSVIIASYNTSQITRDCVRSVLAESEAGSIEVLVVDDASTDTSVEDLRREFPSITVLVNPINVHYTKTNNRGLRESNGRYAVLLNSDTIIRDAALSKLVAYMDANPDVAACGPKLINPDGSTQYCIRSFPGVTVMFFQALNIHKLWPSNPVTNRYYHLDLDYDKTQDVESLGTTAFVIRRETWERYGVLDEQFKIAFTDLAYCAMLRSHGSRIVYVGDAVVEHLGSQSINLSSSDEVKSRAGGLRTLYDTYLCERDPKWKRPIVRAGITAWGWLRRVEHRLSKDKRVITGPGAPRVRSPSST
jgi:GT2 family glycosyltransferase